MIYENYLKTFRVDIGNNRNNTNLTNHIQLLVNLHTSYESLEECLVLVASFIINSDTDVKSYLPVSSSYISIPKDQKSDEISCPLLRMISGATYSGVPQNVHVFLPNPTFLAKPKSTCKFICKNH